MTQKEIKNYLRVDGDEENELLEMLQLEAEEYLEGSGIKKDYSKKRYCLAVLLLVSDSYENRQIRSEGTKRVNTSDRISRLILQLQLEEGAQT